MDMIAVQRYGLEVSWDNHSIPAMGETQAQLSKVEACFYILCLLHLRDNCIHIMKLTLHSGNKLHVIIVHSMMFSIHCTFTFFFKMSKIDFIVADIFVNVSTLQFVKLYFIACL